MAADMNTIFVRALVGTNFKAAVALRGSFLIQVVFMALNNFTFFVFWWVLMHRVTSLRGWRIGDIQLLFGMVAVAFGLTVTLAGGVRYLGRLIDEGDLDTLLTQPQSVLVHALGMRLQPSGFGDVLSGLIFIAWSGQVSWRQVPVLLMAIIASALVFIACGIIFFSLAFWLGKIESVARQLWELLVTFSLYPEPLFGGPLRLVLFTVLPAGFVGYLPARVVQAPSAGQIATLLAGSSAYFATAVWVFHRGLRRYASGSRFSTFG
jgi:ABC-2 type transport system permease protein